MIYIVSLNTISDGYKVFMSAMTIIYCIHSIFIFLLLSFYCNLREIFRVETYCKLWIPYVLGMVVIHLYHTYICLQFCNHQHWNETKQIGHIFLDEELYSYTNYSMETPTPSSPGDCLQGIFQNLDSLTPGMDSDFDECLAVPESLSVIETDKCKEETDASGEIFLHFVYIFLNWIFLCVTCVNYWIKYKCKY